jgi:hypothetical protein
VIKFVGDFPGTPVSSTYKTVRHDINIVESGVKHHNTPNPKYCIRNMSTFFLREGCNFESSLTKQLRSLTPPHMYDFP